jgi:ABC-2 type transport system permease protein
MRRLANILYLGAKEFVALRHDPVLVILIIYGFTVMVYVPAQGTGLEVRNASVAVVDEDGGQLSLRLADAFLPPYFQQPAFLSPGEIDEVMDGGLYTFVLDIPPDFEADLLAGRPTGLQLNVDATAMSQAGIGTQYILSILHGEIARYLEGREAVAASIEPVIRVDYNPNLYSDWFLGVMMIINVITMLAVVLTGAALIREREHGTLEHLLVMPLGSLEIMLAKVWSNAVIVVGAAVVSLLVIVGGLLDVPLQDALPLFAAAAFVYLFAANAIGIFLATVARTMPQLGLLAIPVIFPMVGLSGNTTPLESMPAFIQFVMWFSPSTHFVKIAQGVIYRGAGFEILWREFLIMAGIGLVFFMVALARLRRSLAFVS